MADDSIEKIDGGITAPLGFLAAGVRCGIKSSGEDLAVIFTPSVAVAEAMFTTNQICAAPVEISRKRIRQRAARAIVVNAGIANACTGSRGLKDAVQMTELTAEGLGIFHKEVLVASTGIIGHPLDMEKIETGIQLACQNLGSNTNDAVARAIMTTDTVPKSAARRIYLGKQRIPVTLGGVAKGSGMIHPNMATLLVFLTTDAAIEAKYLRKALKSAVQDSFNLLTVDGDTSTNDSVFILANGQADNRVIDDKDSEDFEQFTLALKDLCVDLARQLAADGEGATCLVRVEVEGAASKKEARIVARSIASSNLVKAAVFGRDPNWGRILCSAGYSGARLDPEKINLWIGDVQVVSYGCPLFDFDMERAKQALKEKEVIIRVALGLGHSSATAFTCDLTYDYVKINAEYHT